MRKITLLAAFLMAAATSAQITYQSTDFASAGEQFTVTKASGFIGMNFASTGANYNWNYSGLDVDSQTTNAPWSDPNNSGYKFAWCLTNGYLFNCNSQWANNFTHSVLMSDGFALEEFGVSNIVEHSRANASGFEHRMRGISATVSGITIPMAVEYSSPDVVYHFPMVYNDAYTTNGSFSLDLNSFGLPFNYALSTQRNVTVEGWGQLTTPHGTYASVLKVKTVLEKTETIIVEGFEIPINTTTVLYQWFDKDFGIPVLHAEGMQIFGFFVPMSVTYLDGEQCLPPLATFANSSANYNLDTQSASVAFSNSSINYDAVEWNFGDGETSNDNAPSHVFNCPGSHQVTLTVTNNTCIPPQTNTITQTVVITDTENVLTSEVILSENTLTATRNVSGTTYQWVDCDNGNAPIDGATSQSFTPLVSGNYAVMLDTNGCTATSACQNVVICVLPSAAFTSTEANYNPETQSAIVEFNNSSTEFDVVSWDFGDGNSSTETSPNHAFNCPGSHEITLIVTNNMCQPAQTSTITQTIIVTDTDNALTSEVTLSGNMLTATRNVAGTTYQWIDCDNGNLPIVGATAQSFTADITGNYACMMNTNGCEATSECISVTVLATSHFNANSQIQLYPNPTTGKLQLSGNLNIMNVAIYNALGMLVSNELDITSQASGVYFVRITTDAGVATKKVIKE